MGVLMISNYQFYMGLLFRAAAFWTGVSLAHVWIDQAQAADDKTCSLYGLNVANVVSALTHDADVAMAAQDRAYAYCIVLDYPPDVKLHDPEVAPAKTVNISDKTELSPATNDWAARCERAYVSFRGNDGTVLRRGTKKRVLCPLPK